MGSFDLLLPAAVAAVCITRSRQVNMLISKIVSVVADEIFGEYFWAAVPVVAIILGIIALTAISLLQGG